MDNKNTEQIAGKEIFINHYFQTLNQLPNGQNEALINTTNYETLGYLITAIIGVCRSALLTIEEHSHLTNGEKVNILGADVLDVANVLRIAQDLMPHPELEAIQRLKDIQELEKK